MLWDGLTTWVLLAGHPDDVARQAQTAGLAEAAGPPALPPYRWSLPPSALPSLDPNDSFIAEIGVGVVHATQPPPVRPVDDAIRRLHERIRAEFDPTGRLNPGLDVVSLTG